MCNRHFDRMIQTFRTIFLTTGYIDIVDLSVKSSLFTLLVGDLRGLHMSKNRYKLETVWA